MAGIGFSLRRMLATESFTGPIKALMYAAIISTGPWLVSSLSLAALATWGALAGKDHDYQIFLGIVSYCFAFSLIGVGMVQQVSSRYLADRLYEGQPEFFAPAFAAVLAPLLAFQALAAMAFLMFVPVEPGVKLAALVLHLAVNGTWLAMAFLSAAKDYRTIVAAFGLGGVAAVLGGIWGGHHFGLVGQLSGYSLGHLTTFGVLVWRVKSEFGLPLRTAEGLSEAFRRFWPLALGGLAYNIGIWVDKIMCWYMPSTGEAIAGALHVAPTYDNATFLAYLTIVPAMGMFLLRLETDFYDTYRAYFAAIAAHARLDEIARAKREMTRTLGRNLLLLLKVQAPFTVLAILFAPELFAWLKLDWASIFVFRFCTFGALLHIMHLMVVILLLYLEFRLEALAVSLVFALTNALFTLAVFPLGPSYLGMGYAISCAVTLIVGVNLLLRSLDELEFHVFMRHPLS